MWIMLQGLIVVTLFTGAWGYCHPEQSCWPADSVFTNELGRALSAQASLTKLDSNSKDDCERLYGYNISTSQMGYSVSTNAYVYAKEFNGVCPQTTNCVYKYCDYAYSVDLPAYSVDIRTESDVLEALAFARKYDIAVTIKTTGHSYAGSSNGYGSLRLWMWNFEKFSSDGLTTHNDSCGTATSNTVKVGGGEHWLDVYTNIGSQRHIVGGGGFTVSAAGGWLQGIGLSATSRKYGYGVDNVLEFRVVLANGTVVVADACTNSDLFYGLRGGGGGTFGVVTSVYYKTHELGPITEVRMDIPASVLSKSIREVTSWINFWVDESPNIDNSWGGYWTATTFILYYIGSAAETRASPFYKKLEAWQSSLNNNEINFNLQEYESYLDARGGATAVLADANSYQGFLTDRTGIEDGIASRLFSSDYVKNNASELKVGLRDYIYKGIRMFNYFLGGAANEVSDSETAVNPQFRKVVWQIETFFSKDDELTKQGARHMRTLAEKGEDSGAAGINHCAKDEPNWRTSVWGQENYDRLLDIKAKYDPDNVFNCYHCVGYDGDDGPENSGSFSFSFSFVPENSGEASGINSSNQENSGSFSFSFVPENSGEASGINSSNQHLVAWLTLLVSFALLRHLV